MGGVAFSDGGSVTIYNRTVGGNAAVYGGGIF
jgi:hypothetical protein